MSFLVFWIFGLSKGRYLKMANITCPGCGRDYSVADNVLGKNVVCKDCKTRFMAVDVLLNRVVGQVINQQPASQQPASQPVPLPDSSSYFSSPFRPKKHPAKIAMLVTTYLWVVGLICIFFIQYFSFRYGDSHELRIMRMQNDGGINYLMLIFSALFYDFLFTVPYSVLMIFMGVWYFATKNTKRD
jgi:hypothetical protein